MCMSGGPVGLLRLLHRIQLISRRGLAPAAAAAAPRHSHILVAIGCLAWYTYHLTGRNKSHPTASPPVSAVRRTEVVP